MPSRDEYVAEQQRYAEAYERIRAELVQLPGVVDVGVGLKEVDGELTPQMAFRVYVEEKLPEDQLPPEALVPDEVGGFRTDVIRRYDRIPITGFNDEDDWRNYDRKVGGTRIGNDKDGGGTGTLGCFARRDSDGAIVMLSNHHVLFSGGAAVGAKVGQPDHDESCCCTCNEIGEVVAGDEALDCAIAKLNNGVPFVTKIRKIRRADGTVELTGNIAGTGVAIASDEVWKVGARTGLTRGIVEQTIPELVIRTIAPFQRMAYYGDSGSVVVDIAGDVVGLLYAIDQDAPVTKGIAKNIGEVVSQLGITILTTDPTQPFDVLEDGDETEAGIRALRGSDFEEVGVRLRASEAGRHALRLFERHRGEVLHLVNTCRPVTIAWHRGEGPTYQAALARCAKEPAYRSPESVEGVHREDAARRLLDALEAQASPGMADALRGHRELLFAALGRAETVAELFAELELGHLTGEPA